MPGARPALTTARWPRRRSAELAAATRRARRTIDVWPGYVDVLAALLILVIFVLLLFSFAQFLLSHLLDQQESELDVMYRRVVELTDLLGLEQERASRLARDVERLSGDKAALAGRVDKLDRGNRARQREVDRQRRSIASLETDIGSLATALHDQVATLGAERDRSRALSALVGERERTLAAERKLSADARAEIALLGSQLDSLRAQLEDIERALAAAEDAKAAQAARIEDLGRRLNVALAREVNRLRQYRSDFFGRLHEVLGANPSVRVVGDRFVLPSELLFDSGSAHLAEAGRVELAKLAGTLRDLAGRIPQDIDWILRIDGHTDPVPINTARFGSNWELSTARAVSVVQFLVEQGIAPQRLSAAGFGEFHPIDPAATPEAYRRNRRIELKLTAR